MRKIRRFIGRQTFLMTLDNHYKFIVGFLSREKATRSFGHKKEAEIIVDRVRKGFI